MSGAPWLTTGGAAESRVARSVRRAALDYLPALAFIAALIGFWEFWVRWRDVRAFLLPPPSDIWRAFLDTRGGLPAHIEATMTEAVLGLALAAVVGVVLSAALASLPFVRRMLYPLLVVSQNIPLIVLAPLMITWFGLGLTPKVALVALVGFFPIVVSTTDGLLQADRELIDLVRSMGGGRLQQLRHVLVPSALPAFFAGLKISATYAVLAAVFGEFVAAREGLGLYLLRSDNSFRTDQVFVGIAVIALASIALFLAVNLAARLATPWLYISNQQEGKG